jgi:cell division protease FtsH
VTTIARSMVHEYGMGTSIRAHQVPADDYTVSEAMRQTRDEEVQEIAEEAYRAATELLIGHRDLLDMIAERLLAQEVIEREEIQALMAAERGLGDPDDEIFEPRGGEPVTAMASRPPEDPENKQPAP